MIERITQFLLGIGPTPTDEERRLFWGGRRPDEEPLTWQRHMQIQRRLTREQRPRSRLR